MQEGSEASEPVELDRLMRPLNGVEERFAPNEVWVRGDRGLLQMPRVSVIGSRAASVGALNRTRKLAQLLVEHRIVVVSGLAEGVDTAAHQQAIAGGGRTIAVLGTSLEIAYPSSNRELQERIGREHLLLTQFGPGHRPSKSSFPMRNRTMALISHATVLVEAAESSGTQHQAWEAIRLGRPLFLMKSFVDNAPVTWIPKLSGYGARVLGDHNLDELFESLPTAGASIGLPGED
jgi:DNA processing protein